MSGVQFERQFPEPLRCWIAHAPSHWPGPEGWWLDIAREELLDGSRGRGLDTSAPPKPVGDLGDVTYLPPVGPVDNWWRQELRVFLTESGSDPIVQYAPGEDVEAGGGLPIVDLTPALLAGKPAALDEIPAGVHCSWPLIPGLTTAEPLCRDGLERLAGAGASGVHAVVPDLTSARRRKLGESAGRQGYRELFHGGKPEVCRFLRWASELGLAVFPERPPCGRSGRALRNRRIATRLYAIAELIQRTGGSVDESLSFYRAGRWADAEVLDIRDLVRSGNVGLVAGITPEGAREIELFVEGETSPRLARLERECFGAGAAGR